MKVTTKNNRPRYVRTLGKLAACVLAVALLPGAVAAQGEAVELGTKVNNLRASTVSASVITLPSGVAYATRVEESRLPQLGCTFNLTAPAELAQLFDVLDKSGLRAAPGGAVRLDLRFSIVLTGRDGTATKLLFRDLVKRDGAVEGIVDGSPAQSNADLPTALRAWVGTLAPTVLSPHGRCS